MVCLNRRQSSFNNGGLNDHVTFYDISAPNGHFTMYFNHLLYSVVWFKHILLARTVDIIKHMLTILMLQGLEWKQLALFKISFIKV